MTDALAVSILALLLSATGWRLGGLRFALTLAAMGIGGAAAVALGPLLHAGIVGVTGWNTWLGVILTWTAVHVGVSSTAAVVLCRRVTRPPGRRGRAAGAGVGVALGAAAAWIVLVPPSPAPAFEPIGWVRIPFTTLRALRVLRSASPEEAAWLVKRPEVKAVAESESIRRLMHDEAILREIQRAADGDRLALLALAANPDVKVAMDDPAFLERVRAVDLHDLAKAVESRRGAGGETAEPAAAREAPRGESEAWRFGYAIGSRLRKGIRSLRGETDRMPAPRARR